jgi:hypothetical protein
LFEVREQLKLRSEYITDFRTISYEQKVVLFHVWRVNVKTTLGFINISLDDFLIDETAP